MKTKKELKEEYKQVRFRMGVFQIRNTLNDKVFISGSINIDAVWNRHRVQLRFGNHPNTALQKDWNEQGESAFRFEVVSELAHDENGLTDYNKEVQLLKEMYMEEQGPLARNNYYN